MATTTNYSWTTPDDTALVKDGAAAIRSLGTAIDTTVFNNASAAIAKTIVDAKGDLIAATAADTVSRLAVGSNNQVLTADSSTATGLKWTTPASGGKILQVQSATRTGLVSTSSATMADTGLSVSITPTSATSKIYVSATHTNAYGYASASPTDIIFAFQLMQDSNVVSYANQGFERISVLTGNKYLYIPVNFSTIYSPSTTAAITFKTQFAVAAGTILYLDAGSTRIDTIVAFEIGA